MHCKRCDYPLWDLAARVCPECGLGFTPLDYVFVVNSVRFMCPHCRQAYYGTGEGGHLVPRRFACVKCTREIDESEMVLLPTEGVSEFQTLGGVVPWRERAKRGWLASWFATVGLASFAPGRLARFCGQDVRAGEAWLFGMGCAGLCTLISVGSCAGVFMFGNSMRLGAQASTLDLAMLAGRFAAYVLGPLVGVAAFLMVWMGVAQFVVRGGGAREGSFAKTAECFGYGLGACFLAVVPCGVGVLLSPLAAVWVAVSVAVQLRIRHEVSAGRAVWAGLSGPLLVVVCVLGWIVVASWW